jgi:hypothetical protein
MELLETLKDLPEWVSRTRMAWVLGVTPTTIKRWGKSGKIGERYARLNLVEVNVPSVIRHRFPNA